MSTNMATQSPAREMALNVNTATIDQLKQFHGIGNAKAAMIKNLRQRTDVITIQDLVTATNLPAQYFQDLVTVGRLVPVTMDTTDMEDISIRMQNLSVRQIISPLSTSQDPQVGLPEADTRGRQQKPPTTLETGQQQIDVPVRAAAEELRNGPGPTTTYII